MAKIKFEKNVPVKKWIDYVFEIKSFYEGELNLKRLTVPYSVAKRCDICLFFFIVLLTLN